MMSKATLLITAVLIPYLNSEYIPPGPRYSCPRETSKHLLFPCVCEKATDDGIFVTCENSGLAAISVGIGNIAGLGLPVEKLVLNECKISRLFGSMFHRSTIRTIHITDSPLVSIEEYTFAGVNRTLQELYLTNTKLKEFPKEAFKILSNLTILKIDGHEIEKLSKDTFAGSEAAGRIEKLHIINGFIREMAPETFQSLKKLKTLDLHGNRLSVLKKSQFRGLRDTEVLDISHNNISKLDGSHIGDMSKLGWCNASHNNIGEIPRGMFARNTVLKVVHLDNNKIKKLDTNSFKGMRFLRRLFLQDNLISEVGRGTFTSTTRIGTIDLARNKIGTVDFQMFQAVKYAELINLAENNITKISTQAFSDLYLATVNISFNRLSEIEANAFVNCNNMTVLDLSNNLIEDITRNAFDENSYAGEFQLSYNLLKDFGKVPIQNMTGIRVLNVSHNQIEKIPSKAFPKLYELHTVDISYNNLYDIHNSVFQNLFSLRFLNLSHNSMSVVKPSTFGTLPTVLELDLSHNKLADVSRGSLAKLASCRLLDISHNYLDKIFQIPISLGELNFANNTLASIKPNTWPTMNALLRLNLSANSLADNLASDSFANLLTLQRLDLSGNDVTKPPWESLGSMTSLQYLYLQDNNITSLSRSAFGNLPTLFELDLSRNHLGSLDRHTFVGLPQMIYLSLSQNDLRHIPNEAFKGLVALRKLDLSYNQLERIDNKTNGLLDDCLSIEKVNLSHNNFGFLTKKMFPSDPYIPYKLLEVDLSHNSVPVVTMDFVRGATKLVKLDLSFNSINDIRNYVLGNLTSLQVLDLSGNTLTNLITSATPDATLVLPANITELYLQDNSLEVLPVENLVKADRLKVLDVRNNELTSFDPKLVKKMFEKDLEVYFEGNKLSCDCFARPLKHYLNHKPPSYLQKDTRFENITCQYPPSLFGEAILELDEERLICSGDTGTNEVDEAGNTDEKFDLVLEPDVAFRDIQYSQESIYVHWFVLTAEDVADFNILIRDTKNNIVHATTVSYNLRSTLINFDLVKDKLVDGLEICIQAKNSVNDLRKWFSTQCRKMPVEFRSWPKKLNVDKRRLTKKKVKYSWFGSNSVLGLVSDSVLITLCIFLGVCFRRLNDFDI